MSNNFVANSVLQLAYPKSNDNVILEYWIFRYFKHRHTRRKKYCASRENIVLRSVYRQLIHGVYGSLPRESIVLDEYWRVDCYLSCREKCRDIGKTEGIQKISIWYDGGGVAAKGLELEGLGTHTGLGVVPAPKHGCGALEFHGVLMWVHRRGLCRRGE